MHAAMALHCRVCVLLLTISVPLPSAPSVPFVPSLLILGKCEVKIPKKTRPPLDLLGYLPLHPGKG